MSIFISHPISTRDANINSRAFGPLADMGVSGWYGVWYENCHIITSYYYTCIFTGNLWLFVDSTERYCHSDTERRVWRYQSGNQNPHIEENQTTQWSKKKVQNDKNGLQNIHIKLKIE